jgi:hypothetical protein
MNTTSQLRGGNTVEWIAVIGIVVAWFVLQAWVLPRFGVKT